MMITMITEIKIIIITTTTTIMATAQLLKAMMGMKH